MIKTQVLIEVISSLVKYTYKNLPLIVVGGVKDKMRPSEIKSQAVMFILTTAVPNQTISLSIYSSAS